MVTSTADLFCGKNDGSVGTAWLELYHRAYDGWGRIIDDKHEGVVGGYHFTSIFGMLGPREGVTALANGYIASVEEPSYVWMDSSRSALDYCETQSPP